MLLAVLLTIAVAVAIVGYLAVGRGEARSPNELGDRLADVDITCVKYDKIFDERQSKALGCRSDDAQLITITTYGNRPATDEWLEDLCRSSEGQSDALRRGVYIVGEDWIIDMHQLAVPKGVKVTPIAQTSGAIASELGGVLTPYDCTK